MASSDAEASKSGSTRGRKSTPRSRSKKNTPVEAKKTPLRRRPSPRNCGKSYDETLVKHKTDSDNDKEDEQTRVGSPLSEAVAAVEEKREEGDDVEDEVQNKTETTLEEVAPAHDTQLRRNYLQRIYRQLQSTHPNQDDAMIRQFATNVEMETCQKAATRSDYIAAMDQKVHKLMQVEMARANTSVYVNDTQSLDKVESTNPMQQQSTGSSEMQSGYSPTQISQSRNVEYAQALAKAQAQAVKSGDRSSVYDPSRQSRNGEHSFQSLMQNQTQVYGHNDSQQSTFSNRAVAMHNLSQMGAQCYSTTLKTPQNFPIPSNVGQSGPRNVTETQQQTANAHMQARYKYQSGPTRPQQRVSNFQEFSAQIQHLDKSVLIELLWNQRGALAQWQRQAKHLELQLTARQSSMGGSGLHSPYNSPMVSGGHFVSPQASAEAERQRVQGRRNARNMMSQYSSYTQQLNEGSPMCSQATNSGTNWGRNAQVYWDKVQSLKTTYAEQLRIAKRALASNSAPPNSLYSMKAQSVMSNIGLVIDILDEQPTNMQPRKFEVLTSIERFIQLTVIPIVHKVQTSFATSAAETGVTSGSIQADATAVATYASSMPSSQDHGESLSEQQTDNHYAETGWSYNALTDMSRQPSREAFADSAEVKSSSARLDEDSNTPTRVMDELSPSVENSPTISGYVPPQYAPVRPESKGSAAMQLETSADPTSAFATTMTPKEPSSPASEFRLPMVSEMRPPSSPGDVMKDNKVLPSSVDVLNDFTDFPELDFEEDSSFVKENNPSNIPRKRGSDHV